MMLTFQILDGGESFYRPLEGRGLTIGTAAECDIQLQQDGVLDRHARVRVDGTGAGASYWIQAASQDAVVKVNGKVVRDVQLCLGDRIELGPAVLVLGQQVRRPATASDVLEQTSSSRTRTRVRTGFPLTKVFVGAGVVVAAVLVALLGKWSQDGRPELPFVKKDLILRDRKAGRFDRGRQLLRSLRVGWARQDPMKLVLVEEFGREFEATAREYDRLRDELREGVLEKSRVEQLTWLRDLKQPTHPQAVREAANILAGSLTEFREQDRAAAVARLMENPPVAEEPDPTKPPDSTKPTAPEAKQPPPRPRWLNARLADVHRLCVEKQHARALEMLRQALPDVPVEYAEPMRDLLDEVRQGTRAEMQQLVRRARDLRRQGKLSAAVELLRAEVLRFPKTGPLAELYHSLSGFEADLELGQRTPRRLRVAAAPKTAPKVGPKKQPAAPDPAVPDPAVLRVRPETPELRSDESDRFRGLLLLVQDAEQVGDLDTALRRAQSGATSVQARSQLSAALAARAADLSCLVVMSKKARARIKPELGLQVTLPEGRQLPLFSMDGHLLLCGTPEDTVKVGWFGLGVGEVAKMLAAVDMPSDGLLGLAVLCYRSDEDDKAERLLARLAASDADLQQQIWGIVSRGRNEHVDAAGYALVGGRFVAKRFLRVEKLARNISRQIGQLGKRDKQARDKMLAEILNGGGDVADAVALALREQQQKLIQRIEKSPFRKGYAKVAVARERLDKARAHALELIFDHKRYFYPYRPPAVSGEKASLYWKVQKEVDNRVAAVKKVWLHDKTKAVVPQALRRGMGFLLWVNDSLSGLGEPIGSQMQQIAWVDTLPPVKSLNVRNFCKTVQEKRRFLFFLRIETLNEILAEEMLGEGEQSQVSITNGYRLMMGRRILAVNPKIHKAARGHAEEMGSLGYFGHFSPNPAHKTPFQRMSLEGYSYGVSENLAATPSAAGAHHRWLRSSGHHRNILMPSHVEFAVGNSGRLWVQNFGVGQEYENNENFPPPRDQ